MAPAVSAQPDYRSSVPGWDSRGWVLLGEKQVDRRVDQDTIVVGRQAGNFTNLTLAVLDSDLELLSINILFDDGSSASPAVSYFFREGTRTRAIDLPGNNRFIREIRLKYRNRAAAQHPAHPQHPVHAQRAGRPQPDHRGVGARRHRRPAGAAGGDADADAAVAAGVRSDRLAPAR
jgi:hypothetical protein